MVDAVLKASTVQAAQERSSAQIFHAPLKGLQSDIERLARASQRDNSMSYKGYQATLEVAGAFAAHTMLMCQTADGKPLKNDEERIAAASSGLITAFDKGMRVMKRVADGCFNPNWHCGRTHDEEAAVIRAAGQIAALLADSRLTLGENELHQAITAAYKLADSRLRKEGIAEEFWGGLVVAAQIGTHKALLNKAASTPIAMDQSANT